MINFFLLKKLKRVESYKNYYFQQDRATPHRSNSVQEQLSTKFPNKFINKTQWPARSPDLNLCDYFLWGYLKSRVFKPFPTDLNDLKLNIKRDIKNIKKDVLKSTLFNFVKRCDLIKEVNGGHIENK